MRALEKTKNDAALERILTEIHDRGLDANLAELETQGYTILPGVLDAATIERAKTAILRRVSADMGKDIDPENATEQDYAGMQYLPYLLYDDEVFEEILMAPGPLALVTYLLGESCLLSSLGCHFKGPGGIPLPLHSDNGNGMPGPFPPYSQVANVNYALTPYSQAKGALAIVPGSHRLARQPTGREARLEHDDHNPQALPLNLAPGDAVVWHGNTWHGSFSRTEPGVRMNLAVYFARRYLQTQERHKGVTPAAVLSRHANDERLLTLLACRQPYGWQQEGPDYRLMAENPQGLYD